MWLAVELQDTVEASKNVTKPSSADVRFQKRCPDLSSDQDQKLSKFYLFWQYIHPTTFVDNIGRDPTGHGGGVAVVVLLEGGGPIPLAAP